MKTINYRRFPPRVRQIYVALGPILITMCLTMTATLLPQLKNPAVEIDGKLSSWSALFCILGGILTEKIGRKTTHVLIGVMCALGWLTLYFSLKLTTISTCRVVTDVCVKILTPSAGIYISETSDPNLRGALLASISVATSVGLFLAHFNTMFSTLLCCSFTIISIIIMISAPESHTWLGKIGKIDKAKRAFEWCRGESPQAKQELNILITRQVQLKQKSLVENLQDLKKPEFRRPLLTVILFFIISQWSGLNAINLYSVSIIQQTIENLDGYRAVLIMDTIKLIMSIVACFLIKQLGKRPLAILSGMGTFVSLFILSTFTFAVKYYPGISGYGFVPLVALVSYVGFTTIGFVPLPWVMMSEVFPLANRGFGAGLASLSAYIIIFFVVRITPIMFQKFGPEGSFFIYGMSTLIGTVILIIFLPETEDKILYQIEDDFK